VLNFIASNKGDSSTFIFEFSFVDNELNLLTRSSKFESVLINGSKFSLFFAKFSLINTI